MHAFYLNHVESKWKGKIAYVSLIECLQKRLLYNLKNICILLYYSHWFAAVWLLRSFICINIHTERNVWNNLNNINLIILQTKPTICWNRSNHIIYIYVYIILWPEILYTINVRITISNFRKRLFSHTPISPSILK